MLEINADGEKYFGTVTFEQFEDSLKSCDWNWHLIEDEENMLNAKASYEEMHNCMVALRKKYIEDTESNRPDNNALNIIKGMHNKYAPEKYHLQ